MSTLMWVGRWKIMVPKCQGVDLDNPAAEL